MAVVWKYIGTFDITDDVNAIHCDTRDFHCLCHTEPLNTKDGRQREITKRYYNKAYQIKADRILDWLKGLETMSGGESRWRMLCFDNINCKGWLKYIRMYRNPKDKDYFVLTTNVDHQFWINGFEDERIFATQGDYGLMQCEKACHDKLYSNMELVFEAIENTHDCLIPEDLVPACPVCGGNMEINVRKDNFFVEDEKWHEMYDNYSRFLEKIEDDDKLILLELGVGFNTPVIIRYPFEQMTHDNPNVTLIRLNRSHAQAIPENKDKTISFDEKISEVFDYWTKRI